jgi:hypothetical protein
MVLRADYLATVTASGLEGVRVVSDEPFGDVELALIPRSVLCGAEAVGVDVRALLRTFHAITLCARKRDP